MSMVRADAIKHFAARKYAELTISEAYEAAPAAARNGLHLADVQWIKRFGSVPAHDAARRLAIRSRANPDGLPTGPGRPSEGKTERMELRMTPEQKAKVARRGGSAWVLALIDSAPWARYTEPGGADYKRWKMSQTPNASLTGGYAAQERPDGT